jgi:hypothetical protein
MLQQSKVKSTFLLIGADKGGVGKTTLARIVLDYVRAFNPSLRVFDTEPSPGVLKRFFPTAETVELADPIDQAKIIDGLGTVRLTIVDIRAGLLSPTLHLFQRIGFRHGEEAHLAVFHVLGNTVASLSEIERTKTLLQHGGDHVMVKNYANSSFEWQEVAGTVVNIRHLESIAAEKVDQRSQSFLDFAADPANSRTMRGLVGSWYDRSAAALDAVGLKNIVA